MTDFLSVTHNYNRIAKLNYQLSLSCHNYYYSLVGFKPSCAFFGMFIPYLVVMMLIIQDISLGSSIANLQLMICVCVCVCV